MTPAQSEIDRPDMSVMSLAETQPITRLPQEMFDAIMFYVESHRADVCSLSRTCKKLRSLTIHLVFKDVTMLWVGKQLIDENYKYIMYKSRHLRKRNPPVMEMETDMDDKCPRLDLLFRSILENPEYGRYVREINLQCIHYRKRPRKLYPEKSVKPQLPSPPGGEYRALVEAALQRTGLNKTNSAEDWRKELNSNEITSVVSMLILLCPNITSLTLGIDFCVENRTLDFILQECVFQRELTGRISRFQNLEFVNLGYWLYDIEDVEVPTLHRSTYLPMFYLPNVKHAVLPIHMEEQEFGPLPPSVVWPGQPPSSMPSLDFLNLRETTLTPLHLLSILPHLPQITRFEYRWLRDYKDYFGKDVEYRDIGVLLSALMCIKDSLKHFKLIIYEGQSGSECGVPFVDGPYDYIAGHCSLKEFSRLETVSIPSCVLLGWYDNPGLAHVLPKSIVSVYITDMYEFDTWSKNVKDLVPIIRDFLWKENWRESCPRMEELILRYHHHFWRFKEREVPLFSLLESHSLTYQVTEAADGWSIFIAWCLHPDGGWVCDKLLAA